MTGGGVQEVFTYDLLGNRTHYDFDVNQSQTDYYYTHNAANEYLEVDTVDPPVNPYTYNAAGADEVGRSGYRWRDVQRKRFRL